MDLEPHRRAIIVGDIAGHGVAAGDGAAALSGYVRRLIGLDVPLTQTLRAASDFFSQTVLNDETPFASLFVAVADLREGLIEYGSAGHEPGLLFTDDAATRHEHLDPTGPVLGLGPASAFGQRTLRLSRESLLVVVTDGITEARRREGDVLSFFGSVGVARAVHAAVRRRSDPAQEIYCAAVEYAGGGLTDDACVVVSSLSFPDPLRLRPGNGDGYLNLMSGTLKAASQ